MHARPHHIPYQCKITQSTGISTQMHDEVYGGKSHGPLDFLEWKNNKKVKSN